MSENSIENLKEYVMKNILDNEPSLIDTQRVMKIFGIKRRLTIYEWNNKGFLNPVKIGIKNYYTKKDVANFLAQRMSRNN